MRIFRFLSLALISLNTFGQSKIGLHPYQGLAQVSEPRSGNTGSDDSAPIHIGVGVRPPVLIHQVQPEFTEEARRAKVNGSVEIYLWVDENGNPSHVRVVRGLGMGLDEKAVEAVRKFKFRPATQNGKPVKVDIYLDEKFEIY